MEDNGNSLEVNEKVSIYIKKQTKKTTKSLKKEKKIEKQFVFLILPLFFFKIFKIGGEKNLRAKLWVYR